MASVECSNVTEFVLVTPLEESNEYPLANASTFFVLLVAAYLLFVLKLGPDFMKNREPYQLKNTILLYNAVQVVLAGALVYDSLIFYFEKGLLPETCCIEDPVVRRKLAKAGNLYLIGKISELLDTVFFVLRKKYSQVTFLHVYHHVHVLIGSWLALKYYLGTYMAWMGFINSAVHVVMYFYYFMSALGPQYQKYLTWKKYITTFQLVQFVSIIIQLIASLYYTHCKFSIVGMIYAVWSSAVFFYLFTKFYNKTYAEGKKAKDGIQNAAGVKDKAQ